MGFQLESFEGIGQDMWRAIASGWKPGAISHQLLRKLNKAKENTSAVASRRPLRKSKKREIEEKPALIVAKRNGEYIVEMQVYENSGEGSGGGEHCKPMIYKIASPNREEKMRKRARRTQRLIDQAQREVMASDPYNPDICEQTCGKAYKQAIGVIPFDPNNPNMDDCICTEDINSDSEECFCEEEESSDYSSLDLDWEIHFTPPNIANRKEVQPCSEVQTENKLN